MPPRPENPTRAKQRILRILESGVVEFSRHAGEEMAKDDLDSTDCINVLRGGVVEPPELINGTWRYRVVTRQICVVVAFPIDAEVRVVTAWRVA